MMLLLSPIMRTQQRYTPNNTSTASIFPPSFLFLYAPHGLCRACRSTPPPLRVADALQRPQVFASLPSSSRSRAADTKAPAARRKPPRILRTPKTSSPLQFGCKVWALICAFWSWAICSNIWHSFSYSKKTGTPSTITAVIVVQTICPPTFQACEINLDSFFTLGFREISSSEGALLKMAPMMACSGAVRWVCGAARRQARRMLHLKEPHAAQQRGSAPPVLRRGTVENGGGGTRKRRCQK